MKSTRNLTVLTLLTAAMLLTFSSVAQMDKSKRPSPPAQVSKSINGADITIDYSRPSKRGREIFGGLEKYGKVWRTGANESSWIEVSKEVEIEGKKLAAGKYGLFTIPEKSEWTIIFNEKWDGWGAYEYDKDKDVLRVNVPSTQTDDMVEVFTIDIEDSGNVVMAWDQTEVQFSIK
ncbi:MAG: DUF2911 domain-containing protein [Bacteroidota bacterium]